MYAILDLVTDRSIPRQPEFGILVPRCAKWFVNEGFHFSNTSSNWLSSSYAENANSMFNADSFGFARSRESLIHLGTRLLPGMKAPG